MDDEFGQLVVIEDSLDISAKGLVNLVVPKTTKNLQVLCLEKPIEKWRRIFSHIPNCDFLNMSILNEVCGDVIFIDSFNQLAALSTWEHAVQTIIKLCRNNYKRIVLLIHNDCLIYGDVMLNHIKYLSQTYIVLSSIESSRKYIANMRIILKSRKVIKRNVYIWYDEKLNCWTSTEIKKNIDKVKDDKSDLISTMTSFKIAVDKSAEIIKSNLILPYTEAIRNQDSKTITEYDIDDWDDEDPDDDLNI